MPVRAVCPECGATNTLDDAVTDVEVPCRQCGTKVPVPGAKVPITPPPIPGGGPPPLPAPSSPVFEIVEEGDDEDDSEALERPHRRPARDEADDDSEDTPRRRRREDDDDDSDDDVRPSRGPAKTSSNRGLLIVGILLAFVGIGVGGGATAYLLWPDDEPDKVTVDSGQGIDDDGGIDPRPGPKIVPKPKAQPPVETSGEDRTIPLPGRATDVVSGQGGRRLFVHCGEQKKLVGIDLSSGTVIGTVDTPGPHAKIAAGWFYLLVLDPAAKTIRQYTMELQFWREAPVPFDDSVDAIGLGNNAEGPALVMAGGVRFMHYESLKAVETVVPPKRPLPTFPRQVAVRAAANGNGWAVVSRDPNKPLAAVIQRNGIRVGARPNLRGDISYGALSADGRALVSSRDTRKLAGLTIDFGPKVPRANLEAPSLSGAFIVSPQPDGTSVRIVADNGVTFHLTGRKLPKATLGDADPLTPDQRIAFDPVAKGLAIVSAEANEVVWTKVDLNAELAKLPPGSAVLCGTPPATFTPGNLLRIDFKPIPEHRRDVVTLKSGPPNARLTADGVIRWDVPADYAEDWVEFTVEVSNSDRKGDVQTLAFTVQNAHGFKVPPAKPKETKPKEKSPDPMPPVVAKLVQPSTASVPIAAPELAASPTTVPLSGPIRSACAGGGGRYLIFHVPSTRKLEVFDVSSAKVVKSLTVNSDSVLYAASMEKLVVVYPDEGVLLRYHLGTFKLEVDGTLETTKKPTAAAMGSATNGPLVLGGPPAQNNSSRMSITFLDIESFKEVPIEKVSGEFGVSFGVAAHVRVSANGQLLTAWYAQLEPSSLQTAALDGNSIVGAVRREALGHVVPSADGKTVCTEKGMYSPRAEPVGRRETVVPAVRGDGYLTLVGDGAKRTVAVWGGKGEAVATFDSLPGFDGKRDPFERDTPNLILDQRLFLIPEAKMLVVLPPAADRLLLYRVGK